MRYDVVLVQNGEPTHRYTQSSREAAEEFIAENRHCFDGRLVIVPEGWRVDEEPER